MPRARWSSSPRLALVLALVVTALAHGVAAAVTGSSLGVVAVLAPLAGVLLVDGLARRRGASTWPAAAVAVVAMANPLAVTASESPGAGVLALLLATAVALALAGTALDRRDASLLVLVLAPLLVAPLAALPGGVGHGWGTGAQRLASGGRALLAWTGLDPVLPVVAAVAALGLLAVRGRRRLGGALLLVAAETTALDLRAAALVAALPLAALAVVAAVGALAQRLAPAAGSVAAGVVAAALVASWATGVPALPRAGAGTPVAAAGRWMVNQIPDDELVALEPGVHDQLADLGDLTGRTVTLPVSASVARRVQWLVLSSGVRSGSAAGSWTARALAVSRPVATFGRGAARVEVRQLTAAVPAVPDPSATGTPSPSPPPTTTPSPTPTVDIPGTPAPTQAASQLADNPSLTLSPQARAVLMTEPVDDRLVALITQVTASTELSVIDLPVAEGDADDVPRRTATVDRVGGADIADAPAAVASLRVLLSAQAPQYRPTTDITGSGGAQLLVITLPPAT